MDKKVYIIGKVINDYPMEWEFIGVFSNRKQAEAHCKNENYFVGPAILNKSFNEQTIHWPDSYYPTITKKEK